MASRKVLLFATMAVAAIACLPALANATEWMVGDGGGWRAKFNETKWTDGKTFRVGDTLRFMYAKDKHTVLEVGGADFRACNLQANQLGFWNTGNDVVKLDKAVRRWFICSVPGHCDAGMKMLINVLEAGAPAPAAEPPAQPGAPPAPEPPSPSAAPVGFSVAGAVSAAAGAVVASALAF